MDTTQVRDDAPSIENLIGKIRTVNNIFNPFDEDTRNFLIYYCSWVDTDYISAGTLYGDIVGVVWGD